MTYSFVYRVLWNIDLSESHVLLGLNVRRPDHLAPLFSFVRNEPTEFGGSPRHWNGAQICKLCFYVGVGEASVYLLVELLNDLVRRVLGRTYPLPATGLISRQKLSHGRSIRQSLQTRCSGHRQR